MIKLYVCIYFFIFSLFCSSLGAAAGACGRGCGCCQWLCDVETAVWMQLSCGKLRLLDPDRDSWIGNRFFNIIQHFCANMFFFTQCWPPCRLTKHGHHWPPIVSPWMVQQVSNCSIYMIHHVSTWSMLRTLEHELKMMRLADGELMSGQRGSRLSKWISATEEERQKVGLEEPNKIKYLDLDEIWLYICLF